MMKTRSAEPQPLAFQFAAALERYEAAMAVLLDAWLDSDLYQEAGNELKTIKALTPALPHLAAQVIELTVVHAELVFALWEEKKASPQARERHDACVATLRAKALRMLRA